MSKHGTESTPAIVGPTARGPEHSPPFKGKPNHTRVYLGGFRRWADTRTGDGTGMAAERSLIPQPLLQTSLNSARCFRGGSRWLQEDDCVLLGTFHSREKQKENSNDLFPHVNTQR